MKLFSFQKRTHPLVLMIGPFSIALVILIAGLGNDSTGKKLVSDYSYYSILAMTGFWVFFMIPFFKDTLRGKWKAALITLMMTVTVFVSIPPKYRVLSDETNLLSVSQSMTFRRDISNVTQAKFFFGNLNVVQGDLPTRPLLFPFLTSLIHTVSGYRYQNVFVLNFIVLFGLLLLTYLSVQPALGTLSAVSACLLLLSIPTLTLSASSGGFDVCSLFFFSLSLVMLYRYLKAPTSQHFGLLLINLVMLSQIRYESIAYVAVILGSLLILKKIRIDHILKNQTLIASVPFFLIPMLLQRKLTPNTFENPPGVPPFSFNHFTKHAALLMESTFKFKPDYPYPSYLIWLSIGMILYLGYWAIPKIRRYMDKDQMIFGSAILALIAVSLAIVLSHHFGVYPHPTQARLFLVYLSFMAMIPVVFRQFFPDLLTEKKLFAIAALSFALYHPIATEGRFTNALTIVRETDDLYRFIKKLDDPKILLIVDRPGQYTVANVGAVGFGYANSHREQLLSDLKRGLMSDLWVFQKHSYQTGRPVADQILASEYEMDPVKDIQITATEYVRIAKVRHPFYQAAETPEPVAANPAPALNRDMRALLEDLKFR